MSNIINMYCPYCDQEHDILIKENNSECIIKNEKVTYVEKNYYCNVCETEFNDGKMLEENLKNARNQYRKNHFLLTSDEIKEIREKYKLSQADLSLVLGWGEITITRYETKEIQNENYDQVLRQIANNPYRLYDYYKLNMDKFSVSKQAKIAKKIFSVSPSNVETNKYIEEILLKKHFSISEVKRGNQIIIMDKIVSIIKTIVDKRIKLYKTKFAKLLWYIDCLHYKKYKKSITGLAYLHMNYGACPLGLDLILDSKNIVIEEIEKDDFVQYLIKSAKSDYVLTKEELEIIDIVLEKFKDFSTNQIVEYMHKEEAYIKTTPHKIIS